MSVVCMVCVVYVWCVYACVVLGFCCVCVRYFCVYLMSVCTACVCVRGVGLVCASVSLYVLVYPVCLVCVCIVCSLLCVFV